MEISHVIRGDDHLTNTFRQVQIYQAMGWAPPRFGHVPLIHGADGAKLSKRHGAVSVLEFEAQGFLPEALCNYLLRLGWGHGDAEIISRDEAIRLFDIDAVGRAASRMDYAKLTHLNGVWLRQADDTRLTADVLRRLRDRTDLVLDDVAAARILALMPGLKERAKTLVELAESAAFLARVPPLPMDQKASALLTDEAKANFARDCRGAGRDGFLRRRARRRVTRLRGARRQEARPGRPAVTRRADWQHCQPGHRCYIGRAGPRRGPGANQRRFTLMGV